MAELSALGFEAVPARNLRSRHDLFAGSELERLEAFHELVADRSLAAIFFARGGHGLLSLLPRLDWRLLAERPRAYVGYSDLTPLLNEIPRRLGVASFHGPMVAVELARGLLPEERISLLTALAGDLPQIVPALGEGRGAADAPLCEGPLLGGCLSLLSSLVGTPWFPVLEGAILLLEDVGEPSYRIDRMLTHLSLSGSLAAVRGVVLGELRGAEGDASEALPVVERAARAVPGRPVLSGLPFGHTAPNRTVPLGLGARIDARNATLTVGLSRAQHE